MNSLACPTLNIDTRHQRIPLQPSGADTANLVVRNQALGISATGALSNQTRIQTILIDTAMVKITVVIHATLC